MAVKVRASLPPDFDLQAGSQIRFVAVDPLTGDPVGGVVVNEAMLLLTNARGGPGDDLASGPFIPAPVLIPKA